VLDPFSGTGTTALASKRLERDFIGFELDQEYARISQDKLQLEKPNSKIGDVWVSFFLDEIVTIRDIDWGLLAQSYFIPESIKDIDHTAIVPKNGKPNSQKLKKDRFQDLPLFSEIEI
jgi:site-specific DNA-methyltransferase (adenine-specific)